MAREILKCWHINEMPHFVIYDEFRGFEVYIVLLLKKMRLLGKLYGNHVTRAIQAISLYIPVLRVCVTYVTDLHENDSVISLFFKWKLYNFTRYESLLELTYRYSQKNPMSNIIIETLNEFFLSNFNPKKIQI